MRIWVVESFHECRPPEPEWVPWDGAGMETRQEARNIAKTLRVEFPEKKSGIKFRVRAYERVENSK